MIAQAVREFIQDHLESIEQLETLSLLMQGRERWWDPLAVSQETGIDPNAARRALDHLASRNLLAIRVTAEVRYQFQPGQADLAEAAEAFAESYRSTRAQVLALITRRHDRTIREFAEAFRIRRDDDR